MTQQPANPSIDPGHGPLSLETESGRGWSAGLLSVVLHATIFIAIGLMSPPASPPASSEERVVGIALVQRNANDAIEYFSEGGGQNGGQQDSDAALRPSQSNIPSVPGVDEFELDLAASLPTSRGIVPSGEGANAIPNAAGFTSGTPGAGRGPIGGQTRTQVFGTKGNGSTFVYVFDRSSSMGGFRGLPLRAAKAELKRSLGDLVSGNQFQIVFYNETPAIFNPFAPNPPKMFFATEENRLLAQEFVQSMAANGGTRHKEALEFALRMSPDVIFFLTDAAEPGLTTAELSDIRRRNRSEAVINAIEFGPGPASSDDNFLKRLARDNRGQYVYVDVTKLSSE